MTWGAFPAGCQKYQAVSKEFKTKAAVSVFALFALWVMVTGLVAAQSVTISVWHVVGPPPGREVFETIVDEFRAEHPHINVELEFVSGGYYGILDKLTVGIIGGVAPNAVQMAHSQSYSFRDLGLFAPLNDYIENDPEFNLEDWYPPFLETVMLPGKESIYGVPYNVSTPLMYYSPALLDESGVPAPPATWEQMVEYGKKIVRDENGDGTPDIWAMDTTRAPGWLQEMFLGQAGGQTVNDDRTEFLLNSPQGVRAWEFMQSLIHEHGISKYPGAPGVDVFGGRVGWILRSTSSLAPFLNNAKEAGHPLSAAPVPCDQRCYAPIGGGAFYALDRGTQEERDATYTFLKYISRADNLARYAASSGFMVGRASSVLDEHLEAVFQDTPEFRVTYEQLAYAHPETQAPEWPRVQELWNDTKSFIDPIFLENAPVKPILDDVVRKANVFLKEYYERNAQR